MTEKTAEHQRETLFELIELGDKPDTIRDAYVLFDDARARE